MAELKKAVFLDRDGVINKKRSDHVKDISELEILPNVDLAIQKLKIKNFFVCVITNQAAINRGLTTHTNVKQIHLEIQNYLKNKNTQIDAFYYCPHRPDENCTCRKPKPGLILEAAKDNEIDLMNSWMIGDSDSDMSAGKSSGCKVMLVNNEFTLEMAVEQILNQNQ